MRLLNAATLAALKSAQVGTLIRFAEFEFDAGTLYFSTATEEIIYNGNTYQPLGAMAGDGTSKESIDLDPTDYTVTISGVDPTILATFLNSNFLNRAARVYFVIVDESFNIIGDPIISFDGFMNSIELRESKSPQIDIKIEDRLSDWNRDMAIRYNNADQLLRDPTDYCFEFVPQYAGKTIEWPEGSVTNTSISGSGGGSNAEWMQRL